MTDDTAAALLLLNAAAVRSRANRMLALGLADKLPNFRIDLDRLDDAAALVAATTRKHYPLLDVPLHSRWRHFATGGLDRAKILADLVEPRARARAAFDLAIVSVLLDAGAGPRWRYRDPISGATFSRSEGLAVASIAMFAAGAFSTVKAASNAGADRLRVDATALADLDTDVVGDGFQASVDNALIGLEGRAELLRALGRLVLARPEIFALADSPRPGGFFDYLIGKAEGGMIPAPLILSELLLQFAPIWPSRLSLGVVPLGDCWRHPALVAADPTSGLIPLHKLSHWLAYSLIEPLQQAGFTVTDIEGLAGLAEYRNGGLFVDSDVLALRDPKDTAREHEAGSPLVVEWRALTVALLDRLAVVLRAQLGLDADTLPLAKVMQGGTWAAGRALAFSRRSDGAPPIRIVSDGTVF